MDRRVQRSDGKLRQRGADLDKIARLVRLYFRNVDRPYLRTQGTPVFYTWFAVSDELFTASTLLVSSKCRSGARAVTAEVVITPVDVAKYTIMLLVVVSKSNGSLRLCSDLNVSVNPYLNVQQYPMPTCSEVF